MSFDAALAEETDESSTFAAQTFCTETRDIVSAYFAEARKYRVLSRTEERELFEQYLHGNDMHAREQIILHNLRLVISTARTYLGKGLDFPDLIQEGNVGLIMAIERFDLSRNLKFSTYAVNIIRQAIYSALVTKSRMIRVPRYTGLRLRRLREMRQTYLAQHGRNPTLEEMAEAEGLETSKICKLLAGERTTQLRSLEEPRSPERDAEDEGALRDIVFSADSTGFSVVHEMREEYEAAHRTLSELKRVLSKHLLPIQLEAFLRLQGLSGDDYKVHTLDEVAQSFMLDRVRIGRMEAKAKKCFKTYRMIVPYSELPRLRNKLMALSEMQETIGV